MSSSLVSPISVNGRGYRQVRFQDQEETNGNGAPTSAITPRAPASSRIDASDRCPFCEQLLYRPVTTKCRHTFCEPCFEQCAASTSHSEMDILPISYPLATAPAPKPHKRPSPEGIVCPQCSVRTNAVFFPALATYLRSRHSRAYAEREAAEENFRELNLDGPTVMTLHIGNYDDTEADPRDGWHLWTFCVNSDKPDFISKIVVELHPTFNPSTVTLRQQPWELRRRGWAYFTIHAWVYLKEDYCWAANGYARRQDPLPLSWTLHFENGGLQGRVTAEVKHVMNTRPARPSELAAVGNRRGSFYDG